MCWLLLILKKVGEVVFLYYVFCVIYVKAFLVDKEQRGQIKDKGVRPSKENKEIRLKEISLPKISPPSGTPEFKVGSNSFFYLPS